MARERPTTRAELEGLNERFPGRAVISYKELADYLGKSLSTVKRHWKEFYIPRAGGIPVRMIALILSGGIRND